jgi:hypothetical protein
MKLIEMEDQLDIFTGNRSLRPMYKTWINNALLEIANDFELPALKLVQPVKYYVYSPGWYYDVPQTRNSWVVGTSYTVQTIINEYTLATWTNGDKVLDNGIIYDCIKAHTSTSSDEPGVGVNWQTYWRLSVIGTNVYFKKVWRCMNGNFDFIDVYHDFGQIWLLDPQHIDTGTNVDVIGVDPAGKTFGIYPLSTDVLYLWFYIPPTMLSADSDYPTYIPDQYHYRVILPKVILMNQKVLNAMAINPLARNLQYWKDEYRIGLYGEPHGDIGMINSLSKNKEYRRVQGRDDLP